MKNAIKKLNQNINKLIDKNINYINNKNNTNNSYQQLIANRFETNSSANNSLFRRQSTQERRRPPPQPPTRQTVHNSSSDDTMASDMSLAPIRSLDDFLLSLNRFQLPQFKDLEKWNKRVVNNLLYYQTNYFITAIIIFTLIGYSFIFIYIYLYLFNLFLTAISFQFILSFLLFLKILFTFLVKF